MRGRPAIRLTVSPSRASELMFLCAAIRTAIGLSGKDELEALARKETKWISFLTLALDHHVAGIAFAALSRLPTGVVPQPVMAQLSNHAREILQQRVQGIEETRQLAGAFAQGGVPVIPIKGPTLRQRLFGPIPAGPSQDLDLLLPQDKEASALGILAECGYASEPGLTPRQARALMALRGQDGMTRPGGAFVVEPHFRIGPSNFSVRINYHGLWQRARPAPDGESFLVLAPEDEFILLAFHGRKEEWARLKWIADLAAFLAHYPDLDWDVVCDRAQHQLLGRTVGLAALVLHRLTSCEIPLAASARRSPQLCRLASEIVSRWEDICVPRSAFEVSPFQLALCDSAAARVSYLARTMATPRGVHFRIVRLPDWMFPAYYIIKVLHDYLLWPFWILAKRVGAAFEHV